MSKQPGMDAQKVLEHQYITAESLYKTYIRESNDVVKLPTRQMSQRKTQKLSGGSRMFRGASALEGLIQSPMRLGGGQVFQQTNASGLSRMVY
jgi:hypothetical protein